VSLPLLIDQNIGTATNIETMHDKSFFIHLVDTVHDYNNMILDSLFLECGIKKKKKY